MKKLMALLTILMCFASTNVFAQEVRGVETRRVVYEGGEKYTYDSYNNRSSTEYYGWEFTNFNSCAVSVDITLYMRAKYEGDPAQIIATKSIVLQPKEKYTFKHEDRITAVKDTWTSIDRYYVEYKAFKLQ